MVTALIVVKDFIDDLPEWIEEQTPYFLLLYLPVINYLIIQIVGRYALIGCIYPYQNSIIKEQLDRTNNLKFGEEFAKYFESFIYTLRCQSGLQDRSSQSLNFTARSSQRKTKRTMSLKSISEDITTSESALDFLTFNEMKNVVDLLQLYSDVNRKVIDEGENTTSIFRMFTDVMFEIIEQLKNLPLELDQHEVEQFKNLDCYKLQNKMTVWSYFEHFTKLSQAKKAPNYSGPKESDFLQKVPTIKTFEAQVQVLKKLDGLSQ